MKNVKNKIAQYPNTEVFQINKPLHEGFDGEMREWYSSIEECLDLYDEVIDTVRSGYGVVLSTPCFQTIIGAGLTREEATAHAAFNLTAGDLDEETGHRPALVFTMGQWEVRHMEKRAAQGIEVHECVEAWLASLN